MDMDMKFFRKLPVPKDLKEQFPADERIVKIKQERDPEIRRIFEGKSDKLLLIIGPCSADREDAVLDYVTRLSKVQEKVKDKIMIIPRIYTNKPRTTGGGYKGLVHQPDPEKKPDMLQGIIAVRELHQKAILESGLTCADEMLYPENHRYVSDLLSYVAIGARSVEDQQLSSDSKRCRNSCRNEESDRWRFICYDEFYYSSAGAACIPVSWMGSTVSW